jgi:hypothetical protein
VVKAGEGLEVPKYILLELRALIDIECCYVNLALLQCIQIVADIDISFLPEVHQLMKRFQHRNETRK